MLSNMKLHMKTVIMAVFVCILTHAGAYCDDGLIWNYKKDDFLNYLKNEDPKQIEERQQILDDEVKKALDINLLPVNLEDCAAIALQNSAAYKVSKSRRTEAKWIYANSMGFLIPEVYYRYQYQDVSGTVLVGGVLIDSIHYNPVYSGFVFEYPILADFRQYFLAASKKNLLKAMDHNVNYTKEDLLLRTAVAYYDLLESKLSIEVLIVNLRDRQEQLRLMKARFEIGIGTKFDVLRAEAESARAKQQVITALNDLRLRQAFLANTIGIDVTTTLYPTETGLTPRDLMDKKQDIDSLYNIALVTREDIKAKEKEVRSLNYLRKMNYADFAPQVYLSYEHARVGATQYGSLRPNYIYSLNAVVPLGKKMGYGTITQEKADAARLYTAELELAQLKADVKESILTSYYSSRSATEKIDASEKEVTSADESLRFSLVGFDVGTTTFIDVLNSQTTKTQARMALISSIVEYNKAQTRMLFDSGTLTTKSMLKDYDAPTHLHYKIDPCD